VGHSERRGTEVPGHSDIGAPSPCTSLNIAQSQTSVRPVATAMLEVYHVEASRISTYAGNTVVVELLTSRNTRSVNNLLIFRRVQLLLTLCSQSHTSNMAGGFTLSSLMSLHLMRNLFSHKTQQRIKVRKMRTNKHVK